MVKSNRLLTGVITSILFFLLFYDHHGLGLNVLLFAVAIFFLVQFFANWNNKSAFWTSLLPAIAGISVLWHGNTLALFSVFFALLFLASQQNSALFTFWEGSIIAFFNFAVSPFFLPLNIVKGVQRPESTLSRFKLVQALPLLLVLLFGTLYYYASPVFANLLNQFKWMNLGEIILILFLGAMVSHTIFNTVCPAFILKIIKGNKPFENKQTLPISQRSWILTIWTLCFLLGVVIITDVYYRFIVTTLPKGLTLSSYLHQGVFSLVLSVILASALSLLVISNPKLSSVKSIVNGLYVFVSFNLVFVVLTSLRNINYINEFGMSEKRIGVFFYLLMCSISAILALIGILNRFHPKFLYRQMGTATLIVLVSASMVNWSTTITKYNLKNAPAYSGYIDYRYLLTLNESNLPLLIPHQDKMPPEDAQWLQNKISYHKSQSNTSQNDLRSFVIDKWMLTKNLSQLNN